MVVMYTLKSIAVLETGRNMTAAASLLVALLTLPVIAGKHSEIFIGLRTPTGIKKKLLSRVGIPHTF